MKLHVTMRMLGRRAVASLLVVASAASVGWFPCNVYAASHMRASSTQKPHCRTCTQNGAVATPGTEGQECTYEAAGWNYWCDCQACKDCSSSEEYDTNVLITQFAGTCQGIFCSQALQTGTFVAYYMNIKTTTTMPNCPPGGS